MAKKRKYKGVKHIKGSTFQIDYQIGLTRKQEWIEANSEKMARDIREERKVDLRRQLTLPQDEQARFNAGFNEAWHKLEMDLSGKPRKTLLRFRRTFWRIFGEFVPKKFPHIKSVGQATLPVFSEYIGYYVGELGFDPNGGLRAEIVIIRTMMKRLYRLGYCHKSILEALEALPKPKQRKKEYPEIPLSKLKEMFSFIRQNRPDYYFILMFLCRTGRRIEEATLIQKSDIIWQGLNAVRINIRGATTKTGEPAPLTRLDADLQKLIKEVYRISVHKKSPYLFVSRRSGKLTSGRVRDYLKRVSEQMLGIAITPHHFRHRFLTLAGQAGVSMVNIMAVSGIKDIGVLTKYYSHATNEGQDKVLEVTKV